MMMFLVTMCSKTYCTLSIIGAIQCGVKRNMLGIIATVYSTCALFYCMTNAQIPTAHNIVDSYSDFGS